MFLFFDMWGIHHFFDEMRYYQNKVLTVSFSSKYVLRYLCHVEDDLAFSRGSRVVCSLFIMIYGRFAVGNWKVHDDEIFMENWKMEKENRNDEMHNSPLFLVNVVSTSEISLPHFSTWSPSTHRQIAIYGEKAEKKNWMSNRGKILDWSFFLLFSALYLIVSIAWGFKLGNTSGG